MISWFEHEVGGRFLGWDKSARLYYVKGKEKSDHIRRTLKEMEKPPKINPMNYTIGELPMLREKLQRISNDLERSLA